PSDQAIGGLPVESSLQFVPEALVRPLVDLVVERALHVIAAKVGRAHGAESKAALMIGVDQLMRDRRRVREDAEPPERIDPLESLDCIRLHGDAADAMKAVAAGDEVALDLAGDAVPQIG